MKPPDTIPDERPESTKVIDELAAREETGISVTVGKTWAVNWDDWLERLWNTIRRKQ